MTSSRRRRLPPRIAYEEGIIGPDGKWWPPERVQAWCAQRMAAFDRLRREARDLINENGTLRTHQVKTSVKAYRRYLNSYRTKP